MPAWLLGRLYADYFEQTVDHCIVSYLVYPAANYHSYNNHQNTMRVVSYQPLILLLLLPLVLTQCPAGQYIADGACVYCEATCQTCTSETVCTTCPDQAYLSPTATGLSCVACAELLANCARCNSEQQCGLCHEGFSVAGDGTCQSGAGGQIAVGNRYVGEVSASCQGFEVLVNGQCRTAVPSCSAYDGSGVCLGCQGGFAHINGYCIPEYLVNGAGSGAGSGAGQREGGKNKGAAGCGERQFLQNGACEDIGPACLDFTPDGKCLQCDKGFTLFRWLCLEEDGSKGEATLVTYIPKSKKEKEEERARGGDGGAATNVAPQGQVEPAVQTAPDAQAPNTPTFVQPASPSGGASTACASPCHTCSQDPAFCLSCIEGHTTVDDASLAGQCFQI